MSFGWDKGLFILFSNLHLNYNYGISFCLCLVFDSNTIFLSDKSPPKILFCPNSPCFDYSAIYMVSTPKNPWMQRFFGCAVWNCMGIFFLSQQLIPFVRENYCTCESRGKFHANEFFKRAYKISKFRLHKLIFYLRKWTLRGQIMRCQCKITHPKLSD